MRSFSFVCAIFMLANQASASVADYCAALARDQADSVLQNDSQWQTRFDNAQASCVEQYSISDDRMPSIAKAKAKPVPQKAPVLAASPLPKEAPKAVEIATPQVPTKAIPDLVAGTPAWLDYCDKKYVSFNKVTGTYVSKTGVERKCLVTAE